VDDYYWFDESSHTLEGKRTKQRYRLGDRVRVEIARVDIPKRLLDFRLSGVAANDEKSTSNEPPSYGRTPRRVRKNGKRRG
jgi:ribonuclease R